jgi:tetratricopeptide (TPR) repeat protein
MGHDIGHLTRAGVPMQANSTPITAAAANSERHVPLLLVCACAVAAYLNSFPGSFFMDDVQIVARNPLVRQPDLLRILTTDYWGEQINSGLYRPLTILSFAVNRWLLGPEPWGFHLVNVLLHAAGSGLLGLALVACGFKRVVAWGSAFLFAVHPLHTEAVNTAVGRSELLVAVLLFAALWMAQAENERWRERAVPACYALALLAKEHAVVFLALLPAVDAFLAEHPLMAWRRRLPLYLQLGGVTLAWLALRAWGVDHGGIPRDPYDPVYAPLAFLPTVTRILTALGLQTVYLGKLLFPHDLQGIYGGAGFVRPVTSLFSSWGATAAGAVLAYAAAVWLGLRRRSFVGLALLLYALSFAPTANVLFATGVTFAERLAYLPSAWFCLGAVTGAEIVTRRFPVRAVAFAAVAVLVAHAGATVLRNRDYQSPLRLWQADVRTDPRDPHAWLLLATEQENAGEFASAESSYREALRLAPGFADAHNSYGRMLYRQGRFGEALVEARSAAATGQAVFGSAYVLLARTSIRLGRWDEALEATERLPEFQRRRYGLYWELRGLALEGMGDDAGALAAFQREVEVEPQRPSDVHARIGAALLRRGEAAAAEAAYRQEVERNDSAAGWNGLGVALALQGRKPEALRAFDRAVEISPDSAEYRGNLERALRGEGAGR